MSGKIIFNTKMPRRKNSDEIFQYQNILYKLMSPEVSPQEILERSKHTSDSSDNRFDTLHCNMSTPIEIIKIIKAEDEKIVPEISSQEIAETPSAIKKQPRPAAARLKVKNPQPNSSSAMKPIPAVDGLTFAPKVKVPKELCLDSKLKLSKELGPDSKDMPCKTNESLPPQIIHKILHRVHKNFIEQNIAATNKKSEQNNESQLDKRNQNKNPAMLHQANKDKNQLVKPTMKKFPKINKDLPAVIVNNMADQNINNNEVFFNLSKKQVKQKPEIKPEPPKKWKNPCITKGNSVTNTHTEKPSLNQETEGAKKDQNNVSKSEKTQLRKEISVLDKDFMGSQEYLFDVKVRNTIANRAKDLAIAKYYKLNKSNDKLPNNQTVGTEETSKFGEGAKELKSNRQTLPITCSNSNVTKGDDTTKRGDMKNTEPKLIGAPLRHGKKSKKQKKHCPYGKPSSSTPAETVPKFPENNDVKDCMHVLRYNSATIDPETNFLQPRPEYKSIPNVVVVENVKKNVKKETKKKPKKAAAKGRPKHKKAKNKKSPPAKLLSSPDENKNEEGFENGLKLLPATVKNIKSIPPVKNVVTNTFQKARDEGFETTTAQKPRKQVTTYSYRNNCIKKSMGGIMRVGSSIKNVSRAPYNNQFLMHNLAALVDKEQDRLVQALLRKFMLKGSGEGAGNTSEEELSFDETESTGNSETSAETNELAKDDTSEPPSSAITINEAADKIIPYKVPSETDQCISTCENTIENNIVEKTVKYTLKLETSSLTHFFCEEKCTKPQLPPSEENHNNFTPCMDRYFNQAVMKSKETSSKKRKYPTRPVDNPPMLSQKEVKGLQAKGYILGERIACSTDTAIHIASFVNSAKTRTPLACKIIEKSNNELKRKFWPRELDIVRTLKHPNIVEIHSIMDHGSKVYIFMVFAEHGDLLEFIRNHGALRELHVKIWFKQVVAGVNYLHSNNIVHRDLTCENIFISSKFMLKIGDFGLARYYPDLNDQDALSETFCGSLAYAAPEVITASKYDPKLADVWSLGVVFFIMLNGSMPFDDYNIKTLLNNQLNRRWSFRSGLTGKISESATVLLQNCLEPDVTKRYDIQNVLDSEFVAVDEEIRKMALNHVTHYMNNLPDIYCNPMQRVKDLPVRIEDDYSSLINKFGFRRLKKKIARKNNKIANQKKFITRKKNIFKFRDNH